MPSAMSALRMLSVCAGARRIVEDAPNVEETRGALSGARNTSKETPQTKINKGAPQEVVGEGSSELMCNPGSTDEAFISEVNGLFPGLQRRPGCRPPSSVRGFLNTSNQLSAGWRHEEDAHPYAKARVYPTRDGTQGPYLTKWRECQAIGAGS